MPASNKIQFSYLNGNLVVPKIHGLTLNLDCGCATAAPKRDGQPPFNGSQQ